MRTDGPFWLRLLSVGARPDMPFEERRLLHIFNGAAFWAAALGGFFAVVNFTQHRHDVATANCLGFAFGTVSFVLMRRGWAKTAICLLTTGMGTLFFFSGLFFYNGLEDYLLLGMVVVLLLLRSVAWRRILCALFGAGYLAVAVHHFLHPGASRVSVERFATNVGIFCAGLYWYSAVFRNLSDAARREIEEKNLLLERQQAMLEAEHARLMDQTFRLHEANEAKEKLFSVVAHDLRGPVGNLKEALGHLHEGTIGPEEFREMHGDLRAGVDHVYASLQNLLEWAAGQMESIHPTFATVPLHEAAEEAVQLLSGIAVGKAIRIENEIPPGAAARADTHQVQAVFRNLLSNALKFTPPGGRVRLEAAPEESWWRVTVEDTGLGMEPERARRLFDPGTDASRSTLGTRNEKGLGLGLQICREFVRHHRGTIWAESVPGRGTAFHFTLPAEGFSSLS